VLTRDFAAHHCPCGSVCPVGASAAPVCLGASIVPTTMLNARKQHSSAIGSHAGITDGAIVALLFKSDGPVCEGRSRMSRAAVARASARACVPSGILAMYWASVLMLVAFGSLAHQAASPQGSSPNRANTDSTVSVEPLSSVPTSA
jgi:hypothetical protein